MDPVLAEVLQSRIECLVDEMQYHLYRSGYSTIVRESRDFSCAVLDAAGRLPVQPSLFLHAPIYGALHRGVLEVYGPDGLGAGDVFLSNDPYAGGVPHVPDTAVLLPVHRGGRLPGSANGQASELFQEGLVIPPLRLYAGGRLQEDVRRLVLANSRQPALVWGDLEAQVGVAHLGAARLGEVMDACGEGAVTTFFVEALERGERRLRAALRAWPRGRVEAAGELDSDGVRLDQPVRLHVAVETLGDAIRFDFSGCDTQARGPVNLRRPLLEACCFQALLGVLDPSLRYNDGFRRAVEIVARPGTVAEALPPAPVSNYMTVCHKLVDLLIEALGSFCPERAAAHSGGSGGSLSIRWEGGRTDRAQYEILGSAYGAGSGGDGTAGVTVHLANLLVTPVEIVESEFPVRVTRFELIPDSGGAGRFRGGNGMRRDYLLERDALVVKRGDRVRVRPRGIEGGLPGRAAAFVIDPDTPQERVAPASGTHHLPAGTTIRLETAGGGGFGEPRDRDQSRVSEDVAEGRISEAAARKVYGWNGNAS
jgi:N-methylhydantoinase B